MHEKYRHAGFTLRGPARQASRSPGRISIPKEAAWLVVRCGRLGEPAVQRYFPAAIYRADDRPLSPGDRGVGVTIEIADEDVCDFLGPGQPVTLWNGTDMAHGVASRRVFFTSMP